jgi:hypothetical protein
MKKTECFENYPARIVFFSNLVSIAIYAIGASIIYKLGLIWLILYLIFIASLEFKLIKGHCVNCYYYGKSCAFGKGKISSTFFKKGDLSKFCKMQISWMDVLPDFLVSLIPITAGIVFLIGDFNWILLSLVLTLFILAFVGNGIVRSQFACKYCKQMEIGCPAQKLFEKKKKQ